MSVAFDERAARDELRGAGCCRMESGESGRSAFGFPRAAVRRA